jgi:hypothetical protein
MHMDVEGQCHCGAIAFTAQVDPGRVGICHCADCQALSGSPYRIVAPADAERFTLLRGDPTIYVKTAETGARWAIAFCPVCGAPIHAADADNPTSYSLRIGTLKQRAELPPKIQIWCDSALPWAMDLREIESLPRQ